uniref:30S ribosomal protein 3, chloroplastic n=1 Tax=Streptosarcina moshanensis TaxID=3096259 RepID=A0AAU7LJT7_9VIRI|nr:hypothetical chloroplast RF65 [Streptosarcina arenaria]YP_010933450.1 hypothetical chloroplast RF65 [Streptosarcina arenaria]YP_010933531.1 hypothetical chloroplast RF65 [Streptosarcina costaricana]YP_010933554.1 hypothetical chloroplast RF65 [Streptosarcina costaricana]WKT08858.1 hypothetical chloroplast RF65 [Streptosarcina arenaria]WKT08859.1 hypothetical chloroplast RF65 [Streptosarcina arenaria]WKT08959.1 hypothetical chloroplast RF65 [Streptosarcina costaricana]WKT08960.1 hypothetic
MKPTRFSFHPLYLKLVWPEKNIGIAMNQLTRNKGPLALTKYFLWPRQNAWEQLKSELDRKPWIKRAQTILLLNQATTLINCWQRWQERHQDLGKEPSFAKHKESRLQREAAFQKVSRKPNQETPKGRRFVVDAEPS